MRKVNKISSKIFGHKSKCNEMGNFLDFQKIKEGNFVNGTVRVGSSCFMLDVMICLGLNRIYLELSQLNIVPKHRHL